MPDSVRSNFNKVNWEILGLLTIHFATVLMPILQSYKEERQRNEEELAEHLTIPGIINDKALLDSFKKFSIKGEGDFDGYS